MMALFSLVVAIDRLHALSVPPLSPLDRPLLSLANDYFQLSMDVTTGGLTVLAATKNPGLNYVINASVRCFDIADHRWLGDVSFQYAVGNDPTRRVAETSLSGATRAVVQHDNSTIQVSYPRGTGSAPGVAMIRDFGLTQRWELVGDALDFSLTIDNSNGSQQLVFGDIGLPLLLNQLWWDGRNPKLPLQQVIYGERVMAHIFEGGHGGFVSAQSPSGTGPRLVIHPHGSGTSLEMTTSAMKGPFGPSGEGCPWGSSCSFGGLTTVHVASAWVDTSRTPLIPPTTTTVLAGESSTVSFRLRWADTDQQIGDVLVEGGLVDVRVTPGMVLPCDQTATVAIRSLTSSLVVGLNGSANALIENEGEGNGTRWFSLRFARPSWFEPVDVMLADGRFVRLGFSATAAVSELIPLRAQFVTDNQQDSDPASFTDGAFLMWDAGAMHMMTRANSATLPHFFTGGSDE